MADSALITLVFWVNTYRTTLPVRTSLQKAEIGIRQK